MRFLLPASAVKWRSRRVVVALAMVALLAVSLPIAIAQLGQSADPTSSGSQTYFLDGGTNLPPCGGYGADYQTQPSTSPSSATIFSDDLFCGTSASSPGVTTDDVTVVMWVVAPTPVTVQIFGTVFDLSATGSSESPNIQSDTFSVASTSCSSPTLVTMELTSGPYTFNPGDGAGFLVFLLNNQQFSICTGGHYASYFTINPLEQTTTTLTDTTTQTVTSTSTVPSLTVSCSPSSLTLGHSTKCTATTVFGGSSPGTISFQASGAGTLSNPPACQTPYPNILSCKVSFTPSAAGGQTITATYSGDTQFPSASATTQITAS